MKQINFRIELTKYQQEAWDCLHKKEIKELVLCWSRQKGKSVFAEIAMIEAALKNNKATIVYISPLYTQGKKIYREITEALEPHNLIKKKNSSSLILELVNGSVIQFFTTKSPTAIRGTTCSHLLVLDELAYFPETTTLGENVYHNVIKPITKTRKPKILMISTPCGKQGIFYEKYLEGMSSETTKTLVSDIYTDPFLTKEELDELKRTTPPMAWEQEYEVKFLDNALTAFEGFEKCFRIYSEKDVSINDICWIGVDFSSVGEDETILTVINKSEKVRQYKIDGELDDKYKKMADIINSYNRCAGVLLEDNGIGSVMINELKKLVKRKSILHTFTTTNATKNEIVGLLQTAIANEEILFSKYNVGLYQQFGVFTFTINKKTRTISYAAKPPYHDDRIMSLCLALKAKNDYRMNDGKNVVEIKSGYMKKFM